MECHVRVLITAQVKTQKYTQQESTSRKEKNTCDTDGRILPKTNIAPENRPSQEETIVFQPSIFRCC